MGIKKKPRAALAVGLVFLLPVPAIMAAEGSTEPIQLPRTVVTAQKGERDVLELPISVTSISLPTVSAEFPETEELSRTAPDVLIPEFTSRAVSNPFFRGVGGSPANPGVTTYIDGVPQLNGYSSSIELLDVHRVEFVRGPQGALFGRNTPGGLINIRSAKPSQAWTAYGSAGYGNFAAKDFRAGVSGPIDATPLSFSLAGGFSERQGYTRNELNGDDVDSREALFGKGQFMLASGENFEARLVLTGERDRDGDYALGDLGELKKHPRKVRRDFTDGYNDRDIIAPTLLVQRRGESVDFESTSGFVHWRNEGLTDLDYGVASPANYFLNATRFNDESQDQVTQEFRFSSPKDTPIALSDSLTLGWQSGVFLFYRDYDQQTANTFAPPLSMLSGSSASELTDSGAGLYGQARLGILERLEFTAGARVDYESKQADLRSSTAGTRDLDDEFTQFSPQLGLSYKPAENHLAYVTIARGYKAGGFNPPSPVPLPGTDSYDTEHSWNYEAGYKLRAFDGKVEASLAGFYINWDDLQLNQQYPAVAGLYYIGNAGAAYSKGLEVEARWHPLPWLDLYGSAGTMEARFLSGSTSYNANRGANENVSGHRLPFAPEFTAAAGFEARWTVAKPVTLFVRGRVTGFGRFYYDASNAEGQDSYALADFSAGARGKVWFAEAWAKNAFNQEYIPIAIPYAQLGAPSGYVGESGAPATFGLRAGLAF